MDLKEHLRVISPQLCAQFGIRKLAIFGSVARGEETEKSDIDLLAEFADPTPATMPDRYFGLIEAVQTKTNRPTQLLTPGMIRNPFLKRSIERDLEYIYE
jgi:predicted nucleotidyltransferase